MRTTRRTRKKQRGGQVAPRPVRSLRSGSVGATARAAAPRAAAPRAAAPRAAAPRAAAPPVAPPPRAATVASRRTLGRRGSVAAVGSQARNAKLLAVSQQIKDNPLDSTKAPGKGVLIDPAKLMAKDPNPYYIVVNDNGINKRVYGETPTDVVGKITDTLNLTGAPKNTGSSGIGTLINVERAREGKPDKYYVVLKRKRYYGTNPIEAVQKAKS